MRRTSLPDVSARQLEAVLALVDYGSFVAAAAHLRISQPALTRTVKRLEAALGVRLFERTTRKVQVTAAGREFAAVAERMLADLGITVRSVREVAQERRGLVVLSSVMSVAGGLLPPIIAAYRADRPGVEIHIREGVQATVHLRDYPPIALPTDSRTLLTSDAAAATAGVQLRQMIVVTQIATVLALVGAGVGVGIVPRGATRGPLGRGLRTVPLGEPRLVRRLGLIALREHQPAPPSKFRRATCR